MLHYQNLHYVCCFADSNETGHGAVDPEQSGATYRSSEKKIMEPNHRRKQLVLWNQLDILLVKQYIHTVWCLLMSQNICVFCRFRHTNSFWWYFLQYSSRKSILRNKHTIPYLNLFQYQTKIGMAQISDGWWGLVSQFPPLFSQMFTTIKTHFSYKNHV